MPGSENSILVMFWYVYVLQSNNRLYVGFADDVRQRFAEHNQGLVFSTKAYIPWQLIHYEAYRDQQDARRREKYLKSSQGARLLKRMLKEFFFQQKVEKTNRISTSWYGNKKA